MNKETHNNTLVPALRFPEFQDEEGWEEKKILDLAVGGFSNGVFNDPKKVGSGYKLINVIDMYRNTYIDESKLSLVAISEAEFLKNRVITGDIFFTRSSLVAEGIAHSNIYMGTSSDITFDGHLIRLRPKISLVEPIFLHYLLKSNPVRTQLIAKGKVATMTTIGQNDIADTNLSIPTLPEQQKIADCLSSLDELIQTESQVLEALKTHKKGLMQQLFPAEGETVPQLRFPEFMDDGEWEEKSLGEISKLVRGPFGGALKKEIFVSDGYSVYEQSHAIYEDFSSFRYYISEEKFNELKRFSVSSGDLIMSCSGTMGKFAKIPKYFQEGVINQALLKLSVKGKENIDFIKLSMELPINQEKLLSQSAGGAIKNVVSVDQIKELNIFIPKPNEQQKIADCLSSLDKQIATKSQQIEALKVHKKGLMQQLFPTIDNQAI
jgi:type I restriction enzyme S subunit